MSRLYNKKTYRLRRYTGPGLFKQIKGQSPKGSYPKVDLFKPALAGLVFLNWRNNIFQ